MSVKTKQKKTVAKSKANGKVEKAISPDEMALVENIISLGNELLSMGAGDEEQPDVAEAEGEAQDEQMDDQMDDEEAQKACDEEDMANKAVEGANANDKAEDKLEDVDETTTSNISALKSAVKLLTKSVQKSAGKETVLVQAINELTKVVKGLVDRTNEHETALSNIIKGFNIVDELDADLGVQKSANARTKPVQVSGNELVLAELQKINKALANGTQGGDENKPQNLTQVRKSLGDVNVLKSIFG